MEQSLIIKDQMKQKRANCESKLKEKLIELVDSYKSEYQDINDISDETISAMFADNVDSVNEEDKKYFKIMDEIFKIQHSISKIDYIFKRNKLDENGNLDTFLNVTELTTTKEDAKKACVKMGIEYIKKNSQTINSIYKSFSEQNADFKLRYELQKELMCNKYGYTPESFDEYFEAIRKFNQVEYQNKGTNVIKGAFVQGAEINDKFKHLLKPVENWNGEDVVYKSKFVEKYQKYYERMEKERPKNTEGAKLYRDLLSTSRDFLIKMLPSGEVINQTNNTNSTSTTSGSNSENEASLVKISEDTKKSLREQRLLKRKKLVKEPIKEEPREEFDYSSIQSVEVIEKPVKVKDEIQEEKVEYKKPEIINIEDLNKNIDEPEIIEPIIEESVTEEESKNEFKDYDADLVFTTVEKKADISILKTNNPDKLKLYRESSKYGRILYLPYSGYEVLVKRIVNRDQLTYIIGLLQDNKLLTDSSVNRELMSVVYKNIEFFFNTEPSEDDFFKNLSIRDIPILITMMAMISQKEENGKVMVSVDKLVCASEECESQITLKKPIEIDLKEKFKHIYPIELYYEHQYKFRESKYDNIYQAYSNSIDGKIDTLVVNDEGLTYTVLYGRSNYYNTTDIMDKKINEVVFQLFKQDIEEMSSETKEELYGEFDIDTYLATQQTLIGLQMRFRDLEDETPDIYQYLELTDEELKIVAKNDEEKYQNLKLDILEIKALTQIIQSMNEKLNSMDKIFKLITNIRSLKVTIDETKEDVIKSSVKDLYELTSNINNIPDKLFKSITNKYIEYQNELLDYDYKRSFISVTSDDINGRIEITSVLKPKEEYEKRIKEKYKDDEEKITLARKTYNELYNKLENGICTCGSKKFYINHFNLLFFSIMSQMEVKID